MTTDTARSRREILVWLNSRTIALALYGMMGLEVGLATLFAGGPTSVEDLFGIQTRLIIGLFAAIGGLCTLFGAIKSDRTLCGWYATLFGTMLMALWCFVVGTAYFVATLRAGVAVALPWHAIPHQYARLYIPLFYQSVLLLILLHFVTLLRLGRPDRD